MGRSPPGGFAFGIDAARAPLPLQRAPKGPRPATDGGLRFFAHVLPSEGRPFEQYTFNLWPRFASATVTGNAQISDFAPDNSNVHVAIVPESGSFALVAGPVVLTLLGGPP